MNIAVAYLPTNRINPNPWNPNEMTEEMLRKEMTSIEQFGFVDPVTVRKLGRDWQLIDGEQRWRAGKRLGHAEIPSVIIDVPDDVVAQQLTIVLNDLRGQNRPEKLAELVKEIATRRSIVELEAVLPYKRQQLMDMIAERKDEVDWTELQKPVQTKEPDRWVERVYRLPIGAAEVIDQAIAKARGSDELSYDWQALELIAADYMAG